MSSEESKVRTDVKHVEVEPAKEMLNNKTHGYLDVRAPDIFAAGHIEGAINVPYYVPGSDKVKHLNFEQEVLSKFSKEDGILVACGTGNRSVLAAKDLTAAGFKNVHSVLGGYRDWIKNNSQ